MRFVGPFRSWWSILCIGACALGTIRAMGQSLVDNPSFELGFTNWSSRLGAVLALNPQGHLGTNSLLAGNRTATNQGVQQVLTGKLIPGDSYYCAAWVRTDSDTAAPVVLGMEFTDDAGLHTTNVALNVASNGGWRFLEGVFDFQTTGTVQDVKLFAGGPPSGVSLIVDDAAVVPLDGFRLAARNFPGVWIGGVGADSTLKSNPPYGETVTTDYHICGAENVLKFAGTEPASNSFSWTAADTIVNTAIANGQQTRGHTLVWHSGLPNWVSTNTTWTTSQLQTILFNHIDTVASRYRDKLFCWDVVNEALNTDGTMRSTLWYNQPGIGFAGQGSNYLAEIYRRARAAAPNAKLVYNDYSEDEDNAKSDGMYAMVRGFQSNGVPIDAVGFQMHIGKGGPNLASMRSNFQRFNDLGVDLHITELDVKVNIDTNTGIVTNSADLTTQANTYFNVYGTALAFPRTRVIQTWGYTDRYSWIPGFSPGYGAALPLDENLNRKLAWWAIYNVLANQAENLPVTAISAGDSTSITTNTSFSAGKARLFSAGATNDFMTLKLTIPYRGEYNVRVGVRKDNTSGQFQLATAPVAGGTFANLGSKQDLYASTASYTELSVATTTFASAGDYYFRFTVAGKNSSSTGFGLALDYLRLTPTGSEGNQTPYADAIADRATLKNHAFEPIAFRVYDRETVEPALSVSLVSSNQQLFPTNNLQLTQYGPQFILNATPAPNYYGTGSITLLVKDADGVVGTQSFNLTVTNGYNEPVLAPIEDTVIVQDTVAAIPVTAWHTVDDPSTLTLSATTSNPDLVPASNLVLTGNGSNRLATITPLPGRVGQTVVTLRLLDQRGQTATNVFTLQVTPEPLTGTLHLNNPGFETPFNTLNKVSSTNSITGQLASSWTENSGNAPTLVYEAETNDVPAGAYAQKVTLATNGSPNFQIIQSFAMVTGHLYTASVWLKSLSPANLSVTIGKASSPYSTYFTTNVTMTNYWRKFSMTGLAPSNVTARLVLRTTRPTTFWLEEANVTSDLINTAPTLAPITNFNVNAGQLVQMTNSASDADVPEQTLSHTLVTGPPNASLDPTTGLFVWRPSASQANTTNPITFKVTDDGTPPLSATQSFKIVVNPLVRPALAGALVGGNSQLQLRVTGDAGLDYLIQASPDLTNWVNLNTNLSPPLPFNWTDTNAANYRKRFYRVLLSP